MSLGRGVDFSGFIIMDVELLLIVNLFLLIVRVIVCLFIRGKELSELILVYF